VVVLLYRAKGSVMGGPGWLTIPEREEASTLYRLQLSSNHHLICIDRPDKANITKSIRGSHSVQPDTANRLPFNLLNENFKGLIFYSVMTYIDVVQVLTVDQCSTILEDEQC
jgi:hypothetical protein